jgi:tryptophanyl-tRNA synthetase
MVPSSAKRILSGVQPTGNLHLGNYLGAIRNWVRLQGEYECIYMIADLHAITVPQNPEELRKATRETAAAFIACGVDPKKSAIFPQSAIAAHAELAWILSCHTPLGWLNRMTQFKEKAGKHREEALLGLYSYPVLMAADVLVYKATHVPVGHDQKQHLELARDIAGAFNRMYCPGYTDASPEKGFFPLPEPLILGEATRVMSLRDGTKKMSKSDESEYSRINLTDDADTIAKKVKKATSDSFATVGENIDNRPEALNLLTLYAALTDVSKEQALAECGDKNFSAFKQMLADAAVAHLSPIAARMRELLANPGHLDKILAEGTAHAGKIAGQTMREVKHLVGFLDISAS